MSLLFSGVGNNLAGICASNSGTIDNCLSSGVITAQHTVGGISANNLSDGVISNCIATAPVAYTASVDLAGAVTGQNSGKMINVVYDSQIALWDNVEADGLAGKLTREIISGNYGEKWIANGKTYPQLAKFANEDAAMLTSFPVIFPDNQNRITMEKGSAASCYTATGLTWRLDDADDFSLRSNTLSFDGDTSYCDDYLKQTYAGIIRQFRIGAYGSILNGSGTEADPWIIATDADLRKLATETSKAYNQGDYSGKHFKITSDIAMTANMAGISVGNAKKFNGIIHGEGHKISNLTIVGAGQCVGLVGYLGSKGVIEDLTIESGTISSTQNYAGGFAGFAAGSITNCTNYATVTNSTYYTGGIAGYASGAVKFNNLKNYGAISGSNFYTGGIAGAISGSGAAAYSDYENNGAVKGTMYVGGIFGWAWTPSLANMTNYGEVGPVNTATCNMHGGVIGVVDECDSITNAKNYGLVSGGSTGVAGVIGRYWPSKNTDNTLTVTKCVNVGEVSGKKDNVAGILGMADSYKLIIKECANTGAITNTAATIAAGTPGVGGIVGGGIPVMSDCFNSGVIAGNNCIGGILGRVPNNSAVVTMTNCTNTGWLTGYGATSANIGSISGYYNEGSTYTNCVYDKQMSDIAGVAKADHEGVEGKNTSALAPEGLYDVPSAFAELPEVILASVPVFFADDDTRYNVTKPFKVGDHKSVAWEVESPMSINGSSVSITGPAVEGDYTLTASIDNVKRVIPIHINYNGTSRIEAINVDGGNVTVVEGGIILSQGEYTVYNINGVSVAKGMAVDGQAITLPAGIYVVKSNAKAVKVSIK